eukprot:1766479-Alexandrium_andersonii.AAC.1
MSSMAIPLRCAERVLWRAVQRTGCAGRAMWSSVGVDVGLAGSGGWCSVVWRPVAVGKYDDV